MGLLGALFAAPACADETKYYRFTDTGYELLAPSTVTAVKHNLYMVSGELYAADQYYVPRPNSAAAIGLKLHNQISTKAADDITDFGDTSDDLPLSRVIDVDTYTEIVPHLLYQDANHIYVLPKGHYYVWAMWILSKDVQGFEVLGSDQRYAKDGSYTYCLDNGKVLHKGAFQVLTMRDHEFGYDGEQFYDMCEPLSPQQVLTYFGDE